MPDHCCPMDDFRIASPLMAAQMRPAATDFVVPVGSRATRKLFRARSLRAVSEAHPKKRHDSSWECEGRFRYSDLREAAFVRGGRYGISIDFGLEVVGKKSTCGATSKPKFIALTMKPKLRSTHRNARQTILQDWTSLESPMPLASSTR